MSVKERKSFTLMELLISIMIMGILASVSLPILTKSIEYAKNREVVVALKLIKTGELVYNINRDHYYPPGTLTETNVSIINTNLYLDIPPQTSWSISIQGNNPGDFTAEAYRTLPMPSGFNRYFYIGLNDPEPICVNVAGDTKGCD